MREVLKTVAGVAVVGSWLLISVFLLLGIGLMSVDEDSLGLSDVVLNPYIMLPYIGVTALAVGVLWLLFRTRS